ncbi:MAG: DUF2993 domain-containing protein [Bacillota bacterium]|nr:DUF2993 domain-containing protein [Bacillota bacterium]MDI7249821.1 DUF2993 domain-containing protein [Bacillota bacterium]
MRKTVLAVGGSLVVVLVLAQVLIPLFLARRVTAALESSLDVQGLEVRVRVFPFFKLLAGGIDALRVEGENLAAGDLNLDRLEAAITSLRLDVPRLWRTGTVVWKDTGQARMRVEVSEESLNRFLRAHLGPGVRLVVTQGRMELVSALVVGGQETPVTVTGVPVVNPDGSVGFRVEEVTLAGQPVPQAVRDMALRFLGFSGTLIEVGQLPWPVKPEQIIVEDRAIVLVAGGGTP